MLDPSDSSNCSKTYYKCWLQAVVQEHLLYKFYLLYIDSSTRLYSRYISYIYSILTNEINTPVPPLLKLLLALVNGHFD